MSITPNQLHFFPTVPEEELIFSRSLHGQSCNRIHMRTQAMSLKTLDRQVSKIAAARIV